MPTIAFKKVVTIPLTEHDVAVRHHERAKLDEHIEHLETKCKDHKEKVKEIQASVDEAEARGRELSRDVRARVASVEVDHRWLPHLDRPVMQLHRLDLLELDPKRICEERPMSREEIDEYRQASLPLDGKKKDKPAKKGTGPIVEEAAPRNDNGSSTDGSSAAPPLEKVCIALTEEHPDDPTQDKICGKPTKKSQFCADHRSLSGLGRTRAVARRQLRDEPAGGAPVGDPVGVDPSRGEPDPEQGVEF